MKYAVKFEPATLPYSQVLHVIAPNVAAAMKFIKRESPGCYVVSVTPVEDKTVYARSDENGNRI